MLESLFSLDNKVALVTGARKGIGKAIALAFAGAGADVAVCSRTNEGGSLNAVADEIEAMRQKSLAIQADVTRRDDVENMVQQVIDKFGRVDILVNNAGILLLSWMIEASEEDWDKTINTDLKGCFTCTQVVGRKMIEQKSGNIINIGSDQVMKATPKMGVYSVAKAGVIMMTRMFAVELARYNIRVNVISPALTKTDMTTFAWDKPEVLQKFMKDRPLGRIAESGDVIGAALYLASDASSYVTGEDIRIDGGLHA